MDEEIGHSQQLPDSERSLLVMVKSPALAIRYQLPDRQV